MTGPLYAIGRFCARHHYPVIGAWVVLAVVLVLAGQAAGSKTSENLNLPGTGSTSATELLEDNLPEQAYGSNPLVLEAPREADRLQVRGRRRRNGEAAGSDPVVNSAVSPLSPQGAAFLSKDQPIGYIPVVLSIGPGELDEEEAQRCSTRRRRRGGRAGNLGRQLRRPAALQALDRDQRGDRPHRGGDHPALRLRHGDGDDAADRLGCVGLACTLSIIRLLEHVAQVPSVAATLATMIGLGVGIDYALFIVTRHKLQLREGMELRESIARATATAGGAVVFAGFTVVIALCSLAFAGIPLVSTLGFTAAISVLVAVCAAVTLLPAMLGALGPRIDSLRVKLGRTHPDDKKPHGWLRWADGVADRPWRSTVAALAVLIVLAIPLLDLELGQNDITALPKSTTARQAEEGLAKASARASTARC